MFCIIMPCGHRGNVSTSNLMSSYMEKVSGKAARKAGEETDPIESLRCLNTKEFAKVTVELKEFRKSIHNIDSRLTMIEQNASQLQKEFTEVMVKVDKGEQQASGLRCC